MQGLKRFLAHCGGATAIEYAMIAGGIALVIMGVVFTLGGQISGLLLSVSPGL